ncbi:MAG: hypothetical protein AVDCRST_MAG64-2077 [uncultured Phycisphaerae bacterium]|uniref:Uncharacterized protein n=1 Tax=uncultured Phycisphaerae bacterium TaxID=904963 RepID=A0A6J4P5X1_9BACT|nr:MAG: hypothetical protein AVDCRST_MAG64-2077 [uncultured Phycisphaerae bacterium]
MLRDRRGPLRRHADGLADRGRTHRTAGRADRALPVRVPGVVPLELSRVRDGNDVVPHLRLVRRREQHPRFHRFHDRTHRTVDEGAARLLGQAWRHDGILSGFSGLGNCWSNGTAPTARLSTLAGTDTRSS